MINYLGTDDFFLSQKGSGSALMRRTNKLFDICTTMKRVLHDVPLTVKLRTGVETRKNNAHKLIPVLKDYGVDLVTVSRSLQMC